jgi:hypothetical protein
VCVWGGVGVGSELSQATPVEPQQRLLQVGWGGGGGGEWIVRGLGSEELAQ